jgi:hypothetical protein
MHHKYTFYFRHSLLAAPSGFESRNPKRQITGRRDRGNPEGIPKEYGQGGSNEASFPPFPHSVYWMFRSLEITDVRLRSRRGCRQRNQALRIEF